MDHRPFEDRPCSPTGVLLSPQGLSFEAREAGHEKKLVGFRDCYWGGTPGSDSIQKKVSSLSGMPWDSVVCLGCTHGDFEGLK